MDHHSSEEIAWTPAGTEHFTGAVEFGAMRAPGSPEALAVLGVRFAPTARSDWHRHPAGQVLYVTDGTAVVQTAAGESVRIDAGGVVFAPAGEVHWHGAGPDGSMTHLSITDGGPTEWLARKVIDEEYRSALG